MIKYILSFMLTFSHVVYAEATIPFVVVQDCPYVEEIQKGEIAKCDGFYFSDDAETEASEAKRNNKINEQVIEQLNKKSQAQAQENQILERRLNLYIQQSDVLSKDVARRDNSENLYRVLYFGLGALLTGYIASNVRN